MELLRRRWLTMTSREARVTNVRYRTIWISDVHLGTRECEAEALLAFLDRHDCDYLYLVGDIVDFWRLRHVPYWPQVHSDVIRKVLSKARSGTVVTLIPGNHDEYLRRFCDLQLGNLMVTKEAVHRTADGRLLLVLHGDEFDVVTRYHRWVLWLSDASYAALVTANRWLNRARRALGFGHWSLAGSIKRRVPPAMSFVHAFEAAVVREAARRRVAGVVCGHVHVAALHDAGPLVYANTGDWVESCTTLVEHHDGRLEMLVASGTRRAAAIVTARAAARVADDAEQIA
jgi:UDP-2,3-diacylglucosamine pyrophosphatase LpxH